MQFITHFAQFLTQLDWMYIICFILMAYAINLAPVKKAIGEATTFYVKTRFRVTVVGILYGILLYFLRGYTPQQIEPLLHSFIFALVFHKLILDTLTEWLKRMIPSFHTKNTEVDDNEN